jgi:hypothetical protein
MRYYEYPVELDAMRAFYNEIGYPEGTVDYSCNTDGRIILDSKTGLKGALVEFKVVAKTNKDVFEQMKRYVKSYNAKGLEIPKYGVYIMTAAQKYTVFDLEEEDFSKAVIQENLDLTVDLNNFTSSADSWLKDTTTQKGWIDETSIVSYNDAFFSAKGMGRKSKDDFIAELANPKVLNIKPYTWQADGNMERKLLDCLGSTALKKRLGAFFTPDYAVEKSTNYIRNIINNLNDDEDYIIVDRCAGTGNLEKFLTDEELSHCILNTIVYAEKTTLKGLYEGRVKAILPSDETIDDEGCMPAGDALSEGFNKELADKIEEVRKEVESKGKKLVVIGLENPPYGEPGTKNNREMKTISYINEQMKKEISGTVCKDLANQFIWSGFKQFFDYYVVYSPVKYFKSQSLINKEFNEGIIVNRLDFHATEGGISIMSWKNEDATNNKWVLENTTVKKVSKNGSTLLPDNDNNEICWLNYRPGVVSYFGAALGTGKAKGTGGGNDRKLGTNNIKQTLPLFAANCYTCKDYTEKEVIMKSGDGGTAYQNDNEFLEDCFIWSCLTDKNKCWSGTSQNEMALSQNSKADQIVDLKQPHRLALKRSWDNVLNEAKKCKEYNANWKYGLAQIINDLNLDDPTGVKNKKGQTLMQKRYPKLDAQITSFKEDLKEFYDKYIKDKLFQYELLK